jgi:hypothetical protein
VAGNYFDQFDVAAPSEQGPNAAATSAPIGPAPPGAAPQEWRQQQTAESAKESGDTLAKASGARDLLRQYDHYEGLIKQAPDEAFGRWVGSPMWQNWVLSPAATLTGGKGDFSGFGQGDTPTAADLMNWHEKLTSARNELAIPKIKQLFGGVPRSTGGGGGDTFFAGSGNIASQAMSTVPGTTSTSKAAALDQLQQEKIGAYDTIADAWQRGRIDPKEYLKTPQTPEEAHGLGPGAMYIHPKTGKVMRNPI